MIEVTDFNDVKNITTDEYFKNNEFAVDMFNAKYSHIKNDETGIFSHISFLVKGAHKSGNIALKKTVTHDNESQGQIKGIGAVYGQDKVPQRHENTP